ncbi:hypothetical protein Plhal304r1_c056g0141481 [Plasmopara halstedii]
MSVPRPLGFRGKWYCYQSPRRGTGAATRGYPQDGFPALVSTVNRSPRVVNRFRWADPTTEANYAITRSLGVYVVGPPATTQAELDQQKSLRARCLVPQKVSMYRFELKKEWNAISGSSLLNSRCITELLLIVTLATHGLSNHAPASSVVSYTDESTTTVTQSHSLSSYHGSSTSRDTAEKGRTGTRKGSAERAPQTPTSSRSLGIPTTLRHIGIDTIDDINAQGVPRSSRRRYSHRVESVVEEDDLVYRRLATRDALRASEDKVRRVLSERLLAVYQANTSLRATVERHAPLESEINVLHEQNLLLDQLSGGQAPLDAAPAPMVPHLIAPDSGMVYASPHKHWVGTHPSRNVWRIRKASLGHDLNRSDKSWTELRHKASRSTFVRRFLSFYKIMSSTSSFSAFLLLLSSTYSFCMS